MRSLIFSILVLIALVITTTKSRAQQNIEASILDMQFSPPQGFVGNAGSMIFDKIRIDRNDMLVILENDDSVFNSDIFLRKSFIGFKGKYHSFGFFVQDTSFLENIANAHLVNAELGMNDERISFSSGLLDLNLNQIHFDFQNTNLFCLKDTNSSNEIDSIIHGCLNSGNITPSNTDLSSEVSISLKNKNSEDDVHLKSELDNLSFSDEEIILNTRTSSLSCYGFDLELSDIAFRCQKERISSLVELDKITHKCLTTSSLSTKLLTLSYENSLANQSSAQEIIQGQITNPIFQVNNNRLDFEADELNLSIDEKNASLIASSFLGTCSQTQPLLINTKEIISACLNDSQIHSRENDSQFPVTLDMNLNNEQLILKTFVKNITLNENEMNIQLEKSDIHHPAYLIKNSSLRIGCTKPKIVDANIESVYPHCFNTMNIRNNRWVIENRRGQNRYFIHITDLSSKDTSINLDIKSFQQVTTNKDHDDDEQMGALVLKDSRLQCRNNNKLHELNQNSIIKNCLSLGHISIASLTNSEKNTRKIYDSYDDVFNETRNTDNFDPTVLLSTEKPTMQNIRIDFKNNKFFFSSKANIFTGLHTVELNGDVILRQEAKELEIKIRSANLPVPLLGRQTWFALWVIKKFISPKTMQVRNSSIYIKLGS